MSYFGIAIRNGVAIGLGSIIALLSGYAGAAAQSNLLTQAGDNLVQENGGLILLEPASLGNPGMIGSTFIIGVSALV